MDNSPKIAVFPTTTACLVRAQSLAQQLQLPLVDQQADAADYLFLLIVAPDHLALQQTGPKAPGPLIIDFISGESRRRLVNVNKQNELLARAVGIKGVFRPLIVDATAGLARDASVLAQLGCELILLERSPIIAALLEDALQRAKLFYAERWKMRLIHADALDWLAQLKTADYPDVIYLDPMYPERTKTALVKKELRYLRLLVGADLDADQLLQQALVRTKQRVVVKRPKVAMPLAGLKPHHQILGDGVRYDIYLQV